MKEKDTAGPSRSFPLKLVDWLYRLSFYSIVAYSVAIFLLIVIAMLITARVVEVPEFHPK